MVGERVQLFRHPHGADLGSEGRTGAPDHDYRGDQRPQFTRYRYRDQRRHHLHGPELFQFVGCLQREDQPDEERDERDDGDSAHADGPCLMNGTLQAARTRSTGEDNKQQSPSGELRQTSQVCENAFGGIADADDYAQCVTLGVTIRHVTLRDRHRS